MSNETPLRRIYFLLMLGCLFVVLLSTAMIFLPLFDAMGQLGLGVVAVGGVLGVVFLFRMWRKTSSKVMVGDNPENATPQDQIRYYCLLLGIMLIVFTSLSVWIILDLNRLEARQVQAVQIWKPVAILYNALGYWPAVLLTPLLEVFCLGSFVVKIRMLKAQLRRK